jgi:hypothetical protein
MHLRTCIQDYYFNLNSNNLLFMATVPLRICLCASGATGHLVYIKGPGGDGVGQIESKPGSTPTFTFIATLFD